MNEKFGELNNDPKTIPLKQLPLVVVGALLFHGALYQLELFIDPPPQFLQPVIDQKVSLAVVTNSPNLIEEVGNEVHESSRFWMVSGSPDNNGRTRIYSLGATFYGGYPFLPEWSTSVKIWKSLEPKDLRKQFALSADTWKCVHKELGLEVDVMLKDVDQNGELDVVLRKRFESSDGAVEETTCAYGVQDGKAKFLDYKS